MKQYTIGILIRKQRKRLDISQVDLAKHLKCTSQFVANWERGVSNPPFNMWIKICDMLKINRTDLRQALTKDYHATVSDHLDLRE